MTKSEINHREPVLIKEDKFDRLLKALSEAGYKIYGPVLRDGAIIYDEITSANELPIGWTDEQDKGRYRLKKRPDNAYFGYVVGAQSWKKYLFPPTATIWQAKKTGNGFQVITDDEKPSPMAFLGVRACELKAIEIQDKILIDGEFQDPIYKRRREQVFTVAVNCTQVGGNCFCTSMNAGPKVSGDYDIALTEIIEEARHFFLAVAGSDRGDRILAQVPAEKAAQSTIDEAEEAVNRSAGRMQKHIDTAGIKEALYENSEHPRWDDVAKRCLSCANCTLVCPTCFCMNIDDYTDLTGETASRVRRWDSCFTVDHSYIHGGSVRNSVKSRYRQWLTHKLASWIDQFGTSGCVGCGRCITWCPAAIDITEEVAAIRSGIVKKKSN